MLCGGHGEILHNSVFIETLPIYVCRLPSIACPGLVLISLVPRPSYVSACVSACTSEGKKGLGKYYAFTQIEARM